MDVQPTQRREREASDENTVLKQSNSGTRVGVGLMLNIYPEIKNRKEIKQF